jgi:hypothetical protein
VSGVTAPPECDVYLIDRVRDRLYYRSPLETNSRVEGRMTQKLKSEKGRAVVCLFCGTRTFVPASPSRDIAEPESGAGISLVRCHICHKEAPYAASEMLPDQEAGFAGNVRSRAAGL